MKSKAIFLDRDGVINEYVEELAKENDFKLYDFTAKAVKKINDSGYLAIVITNQPMVAKGFLSEKELHGIHKKMEAELATVGAKIDGLYYCLHHPKRGFEGEVLELKVDCNCRKPKIGLIVKAVEDFNIDISKSFFIGDSSADAKTAENAGLTFIGVKTGRKVKDGKYAFSKKFILCENLIEAVNYILTQ